MRIPPHTRKNDKNDKNEGMDDRGYSIDAKRAEVQYNVRPRGQMKQPLARTDVHHGERSLQLGMCSLVIKSFE
jgi:hypothetical protein